MRLPWSPSRYEQDADLVAREDLNSLLTSIAPDSDIDDEYDHFIQPGYEQAQALVAKYWDASWFSYGSNATDCPLCYDAAEICAADVRRGSIKEGFKARIAFGVLRYTMKDGQRHAICFVVTSNCQIKYFEPQMASVRWMDQPVDMKTLDNFDI